MNGNGAIDDCPDCQGRGWVNFPYEDPPGSGLNVTVKRVICRRCWFSESSGPERRKLLVATARAAGVLRLGGMIELDPAQINWRRLRDQKVWLSRNRNNNNALGLLGLLNWIQNTAVSQRVASDSEVFDLD